MQKLFATGRIADAQRASNDRAYCNQLLAEFGLTKQKNYEKLAICASLSVKVYVIGNTAGELSFFPDSVVKTFCFQSRFWLRAALETSKKQEKLTSVLFRGKEIFKPINTGRIDEP